MKTRKLHRLLGIVLMLPFIGWSVTGLIFFIKPGYSDAYAMLAPKTYPLEKAVSVEPREGWLEFRYVKTVLGEHLLARTENGWQQLDPESLQPIAAPDEDALRRLLEDAFASNPQRYGRIVEISADRALTDTGVEIGIDWNRLSLSQRGGDTRMIDGLYRIHYLQWTGIRSLDRVLGLAGLVLLMTMTALGAWLAFGGTYRRA